MYILFCNLTPVPAALRHAWCPMNRYRHQNMRDALEIQNNKLNDSFPDPIEKCTKDMGKLMFLYK